MIVIFAAAVLFAVDYVCKYLVDKKLKENDEVSILKDKLIIRKCYNHGLAMNTLASKPKAVLFLSSTALGMFLAMYLPEIFKKKNFFVKLGSAMVLGGAASNILEHFRRGIVVDYLSVNSSREKVKNIVFNLADVFIAIGGVILIIVELLRKVSNISENHKEMKVSRALKDEK